MPGSYPRTESDEFNPSREENIRENERRLNAILRSMNSGYLIPQLSFEEKRRYLENVVVDFDKLLSSSVDSDHAISRLEKMINSFKDSSLNFGILDLYGSILDTSVDSDQAIARLGKLFRAGPLEAKIDYNELLATSVDSDHAISRLEYLASEAREGGGTLILPSTTYRQILDSSVDSDQAIDRLGRLFRNGTVDLSVSYDDILANSIDSDHTIRRLRNLGFQAKEGVLRPIKEKTEELEKKIKVKLVEREDKKGKKEKKSASEIAQESFQEVNKEFGKKHTSVLKLSSQTYGQILGTSVDSGHAIERLGILLSSGPVKIPIDYKDVLDTSVDSDHAITRMEYLGSQANIWKKEYDKRLNSLYVNNFMLEMLKEGYSLKEIEGEKNSEN